MIKQDFLNDPFRDLAYNHPNLTKKILKAYNDKKYILIIRFFNMLLNTNKS
jgi:hypothetical protein